MFAVILALGLAVVAAVALAPLYTARVRVPPWSTSLGAGLVAVALGLAALASPRTGTTPVWRDGGFVVAFVLLLLGALLILGESGEDGPGGDDSGDPPWWPSLEHELMRYTRPSRPRLPTAGRR